MAGELAGKVALVTGASRGLGKAIAGLLAAEGATVGLIDLKAHWAEAAADEIAAGGGRAVGIGADVSDRAALTAAIDGFAAQAGAVDVLVNNAMWNRYEALHEISEESFTRMTAVGLGGIVWGIQAVAPHMSGGGSIVNIGSMAGRLGGVGTIVYSAVKAGVDGLTRAASVELGGRGIRVNSVAPSTVMTEGVRAMMTDDRVARRIGQTPMARLGETDDIAQAVLWLTGPHSSFVTGQSIAVDGGLGHAFDR